MIDLLVDVVTHAGALTVAAILICAVLLNESEKRHRREAQQDIGERARVRAEAHEAMAQQRLYPHAGPGRKR